MSWPASFVLRSPDAQDVPDLVKDNHIPIGKYVEGLEADAHLSFVWDHWAVVPGARDVGVDIEFVAIVSQPQFDFDLAGFAGFATVTVGTGAGDVSQDLSPPEKTEARGGGASATR